MDSVICVWDKSSPRCAYLTEHEASISAIATDKSSPGAISASYDKTLKIWDLNTCSCIRTLTGHTGPVNDVIWRRSLCLSTGRDGLLIAWDVNTGDRAVTVRHTSHMSAMHLFDDDLGCVAIGTQDGTVMIYDLRDFRRPIMSGILHPHSVAAALTAIENRTSSYLVSAGSDKKVLILDSKMGWKRRAELTGHAAPVQCLCPVVIPSLHHSTELICSGGANGWVVVHDAGSADGETNALYATGACRGGVRCLKTTDDKSVLCVAGDDQEPVVMDFGR
eukprot:MONOS_5749.1-p1 / transcript=MONOS_5749.1 / gene=MONOS_5749 / organism=Monocercomonoides_exilis_PA203 / gene_product=WD40 repeat containing protein / transcript_product=WD40 repeat containing protein / location=Mono_scaffold00172:16828-17888(-) / protein_length=277 / sequence_SO=supercontig / SO=protein_coding / is_pseudo=false